jgi:hypothetical protein
MNLLFFLAGFALLAHVTLCLLLQRGLLDNQTVLRELFATPNERLVGNSPFRLLRVRYYFPWRPVPRSRQPMSLSQRVMLNFARATGLLMPVCALAFLALSFVRATT